MKKFYLALLVICCAATFSHGQIFIGSTPVDTTTIVSGLDTPWEILYWQDKIYLTERPGRVVMVDPVLKTKKTLITISDVHEQSESGLLGMALHPQFPDEPYMYFVYNYLVSGNINEKLVRYTYSATTETLGNPLILLENITGAGNHNGSRVIITQDNKILLSTGDAQNTSLAQDPSKLSGKFLRLNLDGGIPADNPVAGSPVWTSGHRNPQGLVEVDGVIYSSEHGQDTDDELNMIEKGRNYGWPDVQGFCNTSGEITYCNSFNIREPIAAWTPTLAVAGIDYYSASQIPEFNNCLLVTTLKENDLRVIKLSTGGNTVVQQDIYFNNVWGSLRDVCLSPSGDVFISTSNRDGRGSVRPGDDKIIKISKKNVTGVSKGDGGATFEIYPNPAEDKISTKGKGDKVLITDLTGSIIQELILTSEVHNDFDLSLKNGVYFYTVYTNGNSGARGKLVVR